MSVHSEVKRVTTHTLQKMKEKGEKISMLTAYDYSFAKIFDEAGIDILLVGDSAANVIVGYDVPAKFLDKTFFFFPEINF